MVSYLSLVGVKYDKTAATVLNVHPMNKTMPTASWSVLDLFSVILSMEGCSIAIHHYISHR